MFEVNGVLDKDIATQFGVDATSCPCDEVSGDSPERLCAQEINRFVFAFWNGDADPGVSLQELHDSKNMSDFLVNRKFVVP